MRHYKKNFSQNFGRNVEVMKLVNRSNHEKRPNRKTMVYKKENKIKFEEKSICFSFSER